MAQLRVQQILTQKLICKRAKILPTHNFHSSVCLFLLVMKKWITYIMSLYILFNAVVPCSIFDYCEEEKTEQTSNTDHKKDCSDCSPFSICSAANGFTIHNYNSLVEPIKFYTLLSYNEFYFSSKSEYYSSFFQPPRFG